MITRNAKRVNFEMLLFSSRNGMRQNMHMNTLVNTKYKIWMSSRLNIDLVCEKPAKDCPRKSYRSSMRMLPGTAQKRNFSLDMQQITSTSGPSSRSTQILCREERQWGREVLYVAISQEWTHSLDGRYETKQYHIVKIRVLSQASVATPRAVARAFTAGTGCDMLRDAARQSEHGH